MNATERLQEDLKHCGHVKSESELPIVKHLVRRLDRRNRTRTYRRIRRFLRNISAWRRLECLAQRTILPFREDNRGLWTTDEECEDI